MARVQKSVEHHTRPKGSLRYGFRYNAKFEQILLTEDDVMYPREGDHIMQRDEHDDDRAYLKGAFRKQCADRPRIRILSDAGINFQRVGMRTTSPDLSVLEGEPLDWSAYGSIFPLVTLKARVLCTVELTSDSTRRVDLRRKPIYNFKAGIPLYIVADMPYSRTKKPLGLLPYRAGEDGYELQPLDAHGRFWIDVANIALGIENGRIACYNAAGERIDDYLQVDARAVEEKVLREHAETRAEQEKARAQQAEARAEQAEARLNEQQIWHEQVEARLRELEAQLKKTKPRKK